MVGEYSGPVFYLVHVPYYPRESASKIKLRQFAENEKKVKKMLEKAALRNIPVILEAPGGKGDRTKEVIGSLKNKPRIVNVTTSEVVNYKKLRKVFAREKIKPTSVVCEGAYREMCVITGLQSMRAAFPKAKLHVIEGSASVSLFVKKEDKAYLRERYKVYGVKKSKKLNPRHFV